MSREDNAVAGRSVANAQAVSVLGVRQVASHVGNRRPD
jgi:hypothetical protein